MNNIDDKQLDGLAVRLGEALARRRWSLACAESCTGGWIAKVMTDVPGSSAWFERGFVTYSNEAKIDLLGVDAELIAREGAVSEPVVRAMAEGALARSLAAVTVAVSGIAGPGGGTPDKPLGTVWFAWAGHAGATRSERRRFQGDRAQVRAQAVAHALQGVLDAAG